MDATIAPYPWKKTLLQLLAFGALFACVYLVPPLSIIIALSLPLITCPLFAKGYVLAALGLPLAPMLASLLAGGDVYLSSILPLFPYLCLLILALGGKYRLRYTAEALLFVIAFLISALLLFVRIGAMIGGVSLINIADYIVNQLNSTYMAGSILYRLTTIGFLTVPESFRTTAGLQLGNYVLLNPLLQQELTNMLRLRLVEGLSVWLPSMLIQGAMIISLFTALNTERARAVKKDSEVVAPMFRTLYLPKREQRFMLALCIGTVLTSFSEQSMVMMICTLMYTTFATVYQLLGAAVMMFMLSRRNPTRLYLYGFLAAVIYLIFPLALFLLGMIDQFMHLRVASLKQQKED